MLKALRRKFVLLSMALVFAVMTVVLLAGLVSNQMQFNRSYRVALVRELALDGRLGFRDSQRMMLSHPGRSEGQGRLSFTVGKSEAGAWELRTPWVQLEEESLSMLSSRAERAGDAMGFWPDLGIAYARQESRLAFVSLQNEHEQLKSSQLIWVLSYLGALGLFLMLALLLSRWALKPVERAWQQQQRFISDASHELKTPLTVILANLDILESEQGGNSWLSAARSEGLLMKKLIENLLFLAHADEARQPIRKQSLCLSDLADEMVLAFEALAYEKGLDLTSSIEPGLTAEGDPDLLRQLVSILLDNAVKYTPAGGSVQISLGRGRDRLMLGVHNSKALIPREELSRLFDRFYRLDAARLKPEGGYGLGLSIAAEIARQHGGSIRASSDPEAGTSFVLTL